MAGAQYHDADMCTHKHFIRPVLYAFYEYGLDNIKVFIKENLGVSVWEEGVEMYMNWLTVCPGNDAGNPIKLYWWMLKFWKRVP